MTVLPENTNSVDETAPVWIVCSLASMSLGIYAIYWIARTHRFLVRSSGKQDLPTNLHTFVAIVPYLAIWGWIRHFDLIRARGTTLPTATVAAVAAAASFFIGPTAVLSFEFLYELDVNASVAATLPFVVGLACIALLIGLGQYSLNAAAQTVVRPARKWEMGLLLVLAGWYVVPVTLSFLR